MEKDSFLKEIAATFAENELLRESYATMAQAVLEFDDKGWNDVSSSASGNGFTLTEVRDAAKRIRELAEGNPLLKRGSQMRTSYVFGRGVNFNEQPPRIRRFLESQQNQDVLFSPEAQATNERSHFTDGQFFALADVATKDFQRIGFDEITGVVTDPDDPERLRYIRRTWIRKEQELAGGQARETEQNVWYPVDTYKPANGRYASRIQDQAVDANKIMFPSRVNRRAGRIFGVPDALPAVPWAYAYNEYLKDGSRLLKSLAMFAWQLKSKSKAGGAAAAAAIATPSTAGSTAIMGDSMEMSAMPRANTVDLGTGRPLASMVASALEVSVVALLSDPGSSGAYGTAQTLDVPTVKAMEARQAVWTQFYKRVMDFFGAREVEVNFPKIETEPSQRLMQALALARETNAIWQDEYREAVIETLDIPKLHATAPSEDGIDSADNGSAIPSQGNTGAVGSMQDNANDLRDSDNGPIA